MKQLLYGVDPKDVPLSRFHRIHEKGKWEKIGFSLMTSVFLTMLLGAFFGDDLGKFGQSLLSSLPFIDKWAIIREVFARLCSLASASFRGVMDDLFLSSKKQSENRAS